MQMSLHFVNEQDNAPLWLSPHALCCFDVLLPGPDEEIGQGHDALYASRAEQNGDLSVGELQCGNIAPITELEHSCRSARNERFFVGIGREGMQSRAQFFEAC